MIKQQVFLQAAYQQGIKLACVNAGLSPEELEKQAAGALKRVLQRVGNFGRRFTTQAHRDKYLLRGVDAEIAKGHGARIPEDIMNRYVHVLNRPAAGASKAIVPKPNKTYVNRQAELEQTFAPVLKRESSVAKQQALKEKLLASRKAEGKSIPPIGKQRQALDYRKSLGEAHKKIKAPGAGATALGGALVGGGVGALASDKDQGVRGFMQGAMIGGGVGAGAGLVGKNLLSAPNKFKAMTEAAKASGQGPEALARIEKAKALYKQKYLARHSGKALLGAGLGGTAGYLGANALLGSGQSPESANQIPVGVGYGQAMQGNSPYGNGNPQMGYYQ